MTFSNPMMLWGLLSILAPILIHFWSRRETQVVKVGSVRLYEETETIRSKRFSLNEWLLLLLRCLLLALLFLWLAGLQINSDKKYTGTLFLIDPLLSEHSFIQDSVLSQPGARWFAEGFPEINEMPVQEDSINQWYLAIAAMELPADSVVIFSSGSAGQFYDYRPSLQSHINWITVDRTGQPAPGNEFISYRSADSIRKIITRYEDHLSLIETTIEQSDSVPPEESFTVVLHPEEESGTVEKLLANVAAYLNVDIHVTHQVDTVAHLGFWLENSTPPSNAHPWILINDELPPDKVVFSEGNWEFASDHSYTSMIKADIPSLVTNLLNLQGPRLYTNDPRTIDARLVAPQVYKKRMPPRQNQPFYPLLIVLGAILVIERYVSMVRTQ